MVKFTLNFIKTPAFLILVILCAVVFISSCKKKQPLITWEKTYGGGSRDRAYSIKQAADKGYFVAAQTSSFGAGGYDYYVIRLDERGNKVWEKTFGGELTDIPRCIAMTPDGGCVVAGRSSSFSTGSNEIYIIKLDRNGNKNWEKVYGGNHSDDSWSIQQTADGGYIVAGFTEATGVYDYDVYILKLDGNGERMWDKTFGGAESDMAKSIQQTADGGYIVVGSTESTGAGNDDVYILKLNANGERMWDKTFGGAESDMANSVQQTADGGYIVAGFTKSFGAGGTDIYILKLDENGEQMWDKTIGGTQDDEALSVHQNKDGSYICAGFIGAGGSTDMYLARLNDEDGSIRWERTFGASGEDQAYEVQQTVDGGFIVAGYTHSDDAIAVYDDDIYLLKLNRVGELNQ
jgi:uncharacterized delta-60 repeat protein